MKTKTKGKAITGIAMAMIIGAVILAATVPTAVGTVVPASQTVLSHTVNFTMNYDNVSLELDGTTSSVIAGQDIQFNTSETVTLIGVVDTATAGITEYSDSAGLLETEGMITGQYKANSATLGSETTINVGTTRMDLDLRIGVKSISSIAVGSNFTLKFTQSLDNDDGVTLKVTGPKDYKVNPSDIAGLVTVFDTVNKSSIAGKEVSTTGWSLGTYTLQIVTKEQYARGLTVQSNEKTLKVTKGEIEITADKTSVSELKTVKLTVTGIAGRTTTVTADPTETPIHAIFSVGVNDNPEAEETDHFNHTIDDDGTRTYAVKFNETGSYTIKVIDWVDDEFGNDDDIEDTVDITVSEKAVVFDLPASVVIGEKIKIKGTATAGETVDIWVDDLLYLKLDDIVIEDGEFSEEVTTTDVGMTVPGSVRIKAWIDSTKEGKTEGATTPPTTTADGDTAILLTKPGLTAELSVTAVAIEDYFTVNGVARGSTSVTILIVPPKGGGGKSLLDEGITGLSPRPASVSTTDDKFTKRMTVQKDATAGYYDLYVLSAGMDKTWGMTGEPDLYGDPGALLANYGITKIESPSNDVGTKTQEDMKNILVDLTTSPGADDLMWLGRLKVEIAHVTLDSIASVGVGEPLVVTGTSNRRAGFAIVITCKMGTEELTPQTVKVGNGTFSATFDTTGAAIGTYTVKADDGDGHIDEATADILTAVPPTPTPVVEVTPTPEVTPTIPVAVATPTPEPTPTPTPTPGFEAVFAIAGLLAVAYLVQRKRRE